MPLPMVHLTIAMQLGERYDQGPSSAFLLGSIAPDAIHMRPNSSFEDKNFTHFLIPEDTPDHTRVRAMLDQHRMLAAFAAGYAAHLLTDRLWVEQVARPFHASFPAAMDEPKRRALYYRETDQIDFNLYHQMSWRPEVWKLLIEATSPEFPPWLTSSEIDQWRVRTLNWFENPAHEPHIVPDHITDDEVFRFIDAAVEQITAQFATWKISVLVV